MSNQQYGRLAQEFCQVQLPLQVLKSSAGFYIGTQDDLAWPVSRESADYYPTHEAAQQALATGNWEQRLNP